MKVGGNKGVTRGYPARATGRAAPVAPTSSVAGSGAPAPVGGVSSAGGVQDTLSVMGIPEAELTPKVRQAIMTLMAEVDRLRQEVERTSRRLQELESVADQDPLLPVLNRRAFVRELTRIIAFAERYETEASVIYFDLNDFKGVNDEHGHAVGDEVLRAVGRTLLDNVRASDVVARLGGDEFGVILAQADLDAARKKADSLAGQIADAAVPVEGGQVSITATYGAYALRSGEDAEAAMAHADKAMYDSKRQARGNSAGKPKG